MGHLDYVITGTGRSGTGFMFKLFWNNGFHCGHESVLVSPGNYASDIEKTVLNAESSWLVAPHLKELKEAQPNVRIIHLIRTPISVIKSFIDIGHDTSGIWRQRNLDIVPFIPIKDSDNDVDIFSQYYISWYNYIKPYADIVLNIDNFDYDS